MPLTHKLLIQISLEIKSTAKMTSFSKLKIEDLVDCLSLLFSNEGKLSPSNDVCQKSHYLTSLSQMFQRFHSASMV